jgi:hypothetical protein
MYCNLLGIGKAKKKNESEDISSTVIFPFLDPSSKITRSKITSNYVCVLMYYYIWGYITTVIYTDICLGIYLDVCLVDALRYHVC